MKTIIPSKLKKGDEIRVIAPSRNINVLSKETIEIATKRLTDLGFVVTFGKNVAKECDSDYCCASIEDRVSDLHDAFKDKNVKCILTVLGGFNINQILDYVDYDLIKNNPKILCGFSDITALLTAIYAKTGLITYYGPHFSSFGMKKGFDYTLEHFKKMFIENGNVNLENSKEWSDDAWFLNQEDRKFFENEGIKIINSGSGEGTIIGGNLCTLNLLQGTEFWPNDKDIVLFIEDDGLMGEHFLHEFDRNLQSLLHCLKNKNLKGIVVGRAQLNCKMDEVKWEKIFKTKK